MEILFFSLLVEEGEVYLRDVRRGDREDLLLLDDVIINRLTSTRCTK